jgi:hypothetical protein
LSIPKDDVIWINLDPRTGHEDDKGDRPGIERRTSGLVLRCDVPTVGRAARATATTASKT